MDVDRGGRVDRGRRRNRAAAASRHLAADGRALGCRIIGGVLTRR
jgi:hypothetical protein